MIALVSIVTFAFIVELEFYSFFHIFIFTFLSFCLYLIFEFQCRYYFSTKILTLSFTCASLTYIRVEFTLTV